MGKTIGGAQGDEKQRLIAEVATISAELKELEPQLEQVDAELTEVLAGTPNVPDGSAPDGFTDEDAVEVRRRGEPPTFDFEPKDHAVLGEQLGMLDTERAARTSGSRFVYLLGDIVQVQFALVRHALDVLTPHGFVPVIPPVLVREEAMFGSGFLPDRRGQHLRHGPGRALPGRDVGGLAGRVPRDRDPGRAGPPDPLRRVLDVLPSRGRHVRQGHGRDVPRPPVRQGGDVLVRATRGLVGRARVHGGDRGGDRRRPRPALPRRERGGGRPGGSRGEEVRPRGVAAGAGPLPGAHVLLELHRLRRAARADAGPTRLGRGRGPAHAQRDRDRRGPDPDRDPRELPAGGRDGRAPHGPARVPAREPP